MRCPREGDGDHHQDKTGPNGQKSCCFHLQISQVGDPEICIQGCTEGFGFRRVEAIVAERDDDDEAGGHQGDQEVEHTVEAHDCSGGWVQAGCQVLQCGIRGGVRSEEAQSHLDLDFNLDQAGTCEGNDDQGHDCQGACPRAGAQAQDVCMGEQAPQATHERA